MVVQYTTSTDYLGVTSSDLTSDEVTDSGKWEEITFEYNSQTGRWEAIIPDGIDITAIAAVGSLSANSTLSFQTELTLDDPQPGDYVSFALSEGTMISTARAYVVSRSIEGLAWMDENADGLYSSGEELLEGVKVLLMQDGQTVAETTTDSTGVYTFTDVAAGDYEIWFTGDRIKWLRITEQDAGADTMDSDAEGTYGNDGLTLSYAAITGISLPDISEIQTTKYVSRHNDAGFLIPKGSLVFDKIDSDSGEGLAGAEFTLTGTAFTTDGGDEDGAFALAVEAFIEWVKANQAKAGITLIGSSYTDTMLELRFTTTGSQINFGYPDVSDILVRRLPRGEYVLEETVVPTGYTAETTRYSFTISAEGADIAYTVDNNNEIINNPQKFTIRKLAKDTGEAMDGVTFTITGGGVTKTIVAGTDGAAEFTFSGLSLGTVYEVTEADTGSWTAYETAETFWFIIEEGSDGLYLILTDASGQRVEYSRVSLEDFVTIQVLDVRRIVELQITKTVDELFETPSFLFQTVSDHGDVYYTAITLDGTKSGTASVSVEAGYTYTVSEVSVSRYALKEITGTDNVAVDADTAQISFTTEDYAQVSFTNTLANWGKFSHTSMIINEVGR